MEHHTRNGSRFLPSAAQPRLMLLECVSINSIGYVLRVPAHHPLANVKHQVRANRASIRWNVPKSIDVLIDRFDLSLAEAEGEICEVLLSLQPDDYCKTSQTPPPPADIYGVERSIAGNPFVGFYVKVKLATNGTLEICAFHPPMSPLRTCGGNSVR